MKIIYKFIDKYKDKLSAFCKNRIFHYLLIDIILIGILLLVYYLGGISDRSMSICLLGTYIISKWGLNAIYMYNHPFKCGLQICV